MENVGIIIVNYRTANLVIENLVSLASENERLGGALKVFVVDNNSNDGSVALLVDQIAKNNWSGWITVLPQQSNWGFAGGNNRALAEILCYDNFCPFIMFLNPDAAVRAGAIQSSKEFLSTRKRVGIVGSQLVNLDGSLRRSAFRYPSPIGEFLRSAKTDFFSRLFRHWEIALAPKGCAHQADWVSGAAFMVRRNVIEQIGLLDDRYFLYYEEVDFMRRANQSGWQVWHNPASEVVHLGGQATRIRHEVSESGPLPDYWYESWRRYYLKNHGRWRTLLAGFLWILGEVFFLIKTNIQCRGRQSGAATISKFWQLALSPAFRRSTHT